MDWIRPIVVTMLGAPMSGKTTFLLGMYATMSLGERAYALLEKDQDKDFELGRAWDRLCAEGVLPPPTPEEPFEYRFTFLHGKDPLLRLDWTDFRGGAMTTPLGEANGFIESPDARRLVQRLAATDSVYLVLDGSRLGASPQALETRRMTALVRSALLEREPARPALSVVVLLTKADRLLAELPQHLTITQRLDRALETILGLLPVMRQPGMTAALCPVTVGGFGAPTRGRVDPATVRPFWLHKPVMFTMFHRLREERRLLDAELGSLGARHRHLTAELDRVNGERLGRLLRRAELRGLESERAQVEEAWWVADGRRRMTDHWGATLREEIKELPVFRDGARVESDDL
ncbi:hypothetical protein Ssi03_56090 [Sphaerisporangium siamense]|uniref:Double-GTPase 2 domain-containing protein n=1 Tax=Sphaerisporangium siamense TaxID=795645 RepID=A0A7W7DCY4_9ACTN|nr:hypothetical protein [Sphaerisporangium siamense]MBB4703386.1 hypothetical protein [Sphaerisporangium siamense]GII87619.1 hypothetical protein Ssi03_56090 [Sphaerisporangium siamense]